MIKAVIFDFDGVLMDSPALVLQVRREVLAMHDIDIDDIPDPHGQGHMASSSKNVLAAVKQHTGMDIDERSYTETFTDKFRKALAESGISTDSGLMDFLIDLREHGIICAIATASRSGTLQMKMDVLQIRNFFKTVVTADDVSAHKPAPDLYIEAMKQLDLQPYECIVIEDSNAGIASGVAAGCKVIGITKYNPDKRELPGTLRTIDSWDEISADYIAGIV